MSRLSEYATLAEKDAFFEEGSITINTKEEIDIQLEKLAYYNDQEYIFRGCSEAKFKLYTSAQRYWIEKELRKQGVYYHTFVKRLIKNCKEWNNRTIFAFFNKNGINTNNSLAYLSYMQHYSVPTPLLDFTDSPYIGLFFALENARTYSSDREIDNYCSLYVIDRRSTYFHSTMKRFDIELEEGDIKEIDYDKNLSTFPIILVTPDKSTYKIINNTNISNQEGLFFYNNSPTEPVEKVYFEALDAIRTDIGDEKFYAEKYKSKFAICLNIHKNLREYVLLNLKEKADITPEFIYPDNRDLYKFTLENTLATL